MQDEIVAVVDSISRLCSLVLEWVQADGECYVVEIGKDRRPECRGPEISSLTVGLLGLILVALVEFEDRGRGPGFDTILGPKLVC